MLKRIQQERPLILNLSNLVTMDFVANGLLSLGASPMMTASTEELEDLIKICSAVVINIGTLNAAFVELCGQACYIASRWNKPIVFDPVGAGASAYRNQVCEQFLKKYSFAVLRGNAGEIMALTGKTETMKGVDSRLSPTEEVAVSVKTLASHYRTVVAVSGETDWVSDGKQLQSLKYGSPLMPLLTGSGCLLSAVTGAFIAVHDDIMEAVVAAFTFYSRSGEKAAEKAAGPGTFKPLFLDALAELL